jgi:16S rRNA C967 or C1407 C5-methylase (RsmB/RsmF family)
VKILVTGGSGFVGRAIVERLLSRGHAVRVLARGTRPTQGGAIETVQGSILRAAARLVKPGGALVYATCSLLERENEAVAAAFSQANPEFGAPVFLHLRPEISETDGFFAARWIRAAKRGV